METTSDRPLPELTQAVLDPATLEALVLDLCSQTQILSVSTKQGEQRHARGTELSLPEAVEALRQGELRGVQVHYRWQDQEWLDTLLRGPEGIKIVRTLAPK